MRVPWSPVSWGCLGNSAAKRRQWQRAGSQCLAGRPGPQPLQGGWLPWGSAQGSQVTRTERGIACDLQGRLACQERVWPGNGFPVTQCHPLPARPASQPTSSLVSLEVDLARADLGFSEATSGSASWLFS